MDSSRGGQTRLRHSPHRHGSTEYGQGGWYYNNVVYLQCKCEVIGMW
jgi:hypothetical protein